MTIFTIGYEGLTVGEFKSLLTTHGIGTVVDVRDLPVSRKPGFSKQVLRHELQLSGFGYVHIGSLGCPKPIREAYKRDHDWERYTEGFMRHLSGQKAAVGQLADQAKVTTCALLCFEADYNFCHRSMVAEAVHQQAGLEVEHITASKDDGNLSLF